MLDADDEKIHWSWYVGGGVLSLIIIAVGIVSLVEWKLVKDRVIPEITRLHDEKTARFKPETVGDDIILKNYNKCMNDTLVNTGKLLDESVYRMDVAIDVAHRFYEKRSAACLNKTVEATANVSGAGKVDLLRSVQKLAKALGDG